MGKREPASHGIIAGILDRYGGRRYTATDEGLDAIRNQVGSGERAFIVPGHREPFYRNVDGEARNDGHSRPAWDRSAAIVAMADKEIDGHFADTPCGTCRACCITLYIADEGDGFTKPSHSACSKLCADGCSLYRTRPATCVRFECVWLKSQRGNRAMPAELRPDRCGAILTDHDEGPTRVHVDPLKARSPALAQFIAERAAEGESFQEVTHYYGERR